MAFSKGLETVYGSLLERLSYAIHVNVLPQHEAVSLLHKPPGTCCRRTFTVPIKLETSVLHHKLI